MKDYSKHVLFVGPHYSLRGGMASVLSVYSKTIEPFHFLPTYFYKNGLLNLLYFAWALVKFPFILISKRDIRIIHLHTASRGSFFRKSLLVLIAKVFQKKTVLHIHGGEFKQFYSNAGFLKGYIKYILNTVDEVICLSDEWKIYFDSITNKKKTIILNNPVIIPKGVAAKKVSKPVEVLFLNHINEKKGIFDLISFFNENKIWLTGSVKLIIAGAGETEKLQQQIAANGLQEITDFKGWVSGKEKDDLIQQSDFFILTSYNEGLPVSILEAMSYKKAIISTSVGGIPRIVKPGQNGWLVTAGDNKMLVPVFKEIISNPLILEQYGLNSFNIVQDYSPESVNETLNSIYAGLFVSTAIKNKPLQV